MSEPLSEANFVKTSKKYPALYCSRCLADEFRVRQPKMCFNTTTYDEYYIEALPDVEEAAAGQQQEIASAGKEEETTTSPQNNPSSET